jgi:hypothetical protein
LIRDIITSQNKRLSASVIHVTEKMFIYANPIIADSGDSGSVR